MQKVFTLLAALLIASFFTPNTAHARYLLDGWDGYQVGSIWRVRVPEAGETGGISHDLTAGDWFKFRVRVIHDDSQNQTGFFSDEFSPTSGDIQLCTVSGCEANTINVGTESLDWDNVNKMHFTLQAKDGPFAEWESFELEYE